MNRDQACRTIERVGVVPVVRAPSAELAVRVAEAIVIGGVGVLEITLTVPDALAIIRALAERLAGRAVVGAGTVLSAEEATACIDAGAAFVVSPSLDLATIAAAHARGVAAIPGALTPTEVVTAMKAGADLIKIFPCSVVGGPRYIRALRGPLPRAKLLPTGGVSLGTVDEYIAAGAVALGVGSELADVAALQTGGDGVLTERAREFVSAVSAARARLSRAGGK